MNSGQRREEKAKEDETRTEEDVALNWVDSTDGLIFSVSTYLSIILPKEGEEDDKRVDEKE